MKIETLLLIGFGFTFYSFAVYFSAKKKALIRKEAPHLLKTEWTRGSALRQKLREKGIRISGTAFYIYMADLAKEGIVESQDIEEVVSYDGYREEAMIPRGGVELVDEGNKVRLKLRWFRLPS